MTKPTVFLKCVSIKAHVLFRASRNACASASSENSGENEGNTFFSWLYNSETFVT